MVLIGPLAMLGAKAGISLGSSLLSSLLNKKSGSQKALESSVAKKNEAETRILKMREDWLRQLQGERADYEKAILDRKGNPLVLALPGVGGISEKEWDRTLQDMMAGVDFGGVRSKKFALDLLSQMTSGNSAGAAAGMASGMEAQRQKNIPGTTGFLSQLGTGLLNHFTAPGTGGATPAPGAGGGPADLGLALSSGLNRSMNPSPLDLTAGLNFLDAGIDPNSVMGVPFQPFDLGGR